MRRSGYSKQQVVDIIRSALRGYKNKWRRGEERHRRGSTTEGARRIWKLIGNNSWFKMKQRTPQENPADQERNSHTRKPRKQQNPRVPSNRTQSSAVLFVTKTHNGTLAARLKEKETETNRVSRRRMKIVKKIRTQIQRILTSSDPWCNSRCERLDCLNCVGSDKPKWKCRARSSVYTNTCKTCEDSGNPKFYMGETSRSTYLRATEHLADLTKEK